jgi:hypothetical protein
LGGVFGVVLYCFFCGSAVVVFLIGFWLVLFVIFKGFQVLFSVFSLGSVLAYF